MYICFCKLLWQTNKLQLLCLSQREQIQRFAQLRTTEKQDWGRKRQGNCVDENR